MINAHPHGAQERQQPIQPNLEYLYRQPSSGARCGHQHGCALQAEIANPARIGRRHVSLALGASYDAHDIDGDNANSVAGFSAGQIATDLASLANGVVVRLTFGGRLETAFRAICKARDDGMGLRHCLHAGDQGCGFGAHEEISLVGDLCIGPLVLLRQEVFAA